MKLVKLSLGLGMLVLLNACASTIKPTYVSPTHYQALSCQQLQSEYNRIQQYINNGVEAPKRTGVGVGVGLGGGWGSRGGWGIGPSVSVNMGQSSNTKRTETARLLGEQEAIAQAARYKNCPMIARKAVAS
ncbi:MAG TPA: hypothetical protein K8V79_07440 [Acinetobacter lwoffii]|uniref:Lipoprotein n=1 Tax=Acinetobacter lwoffii TaxID=28090 RepID=A0A9D2ZYU4_ACILW|nr:MULTISPECIES: hypothetical protein [unclassified Acinetobacter]MDM1781632.1 hypothetical protein [Acinetobacter indicus]QKQ68898.1 hypothetical protein E5Y90_00825 [Acinetobacter sp. 10FS3-1]TQR71214.1 hypothetical protein E2K52_03110 [Acinetobacter sp. RF14B]HJF28066.1 hypothetical protein [Acinetobacter lwoffii]